MATEQAPPTYTGVSSGAFGRFRKAAKDAERKARADLEAKGAWPPKEPIKYKVDLYVKSGNPLHEYIVEMTPVR
ncbi:MAG TPA: hypothetical protein VFO03_02525 [Gaiellaceae bacterium]|nr:hypothetical protein [Gaiellaceae bacterium]